MDDIDESDAFKEVLLFWDKLGSDTEVRRARKEVDECITVDPEFKTYLSYIFEKSESVVQGKRRRENDSGCEPSDDYCHEEVNDPQYEQFLKCLIEHEKSYMLKYKEAGISLEVKYEKELQLEEEDIDREPRRKSRSSVKRQTAPSKPIPRNSESTETEELFRGSDTKTDDKVSTKYARTRSASHYVTPRRVAKVEHEVDESLSNYHGPARRTRLRSGMKQKSSDSQGKRELPSMDEPKNFNGGKSRIPVKCEMVKDSDYLHFLKNCGVEGDRYVYSYNGLRIVYGGNNNDHNEVACDYDDGSLSDVEIVEDPNKGANNMNGNISNAIPAKASGYREQLVTLLKKSYDKGEHTKLWEDITLRRPKEEVKDLRNGRQRRCTNNIDGRSYLDNYPDLNKKLSQYKRDKGICLNLLRGFFFWLQRISITEKEGLFIPWKDAESISIQPGS